MIASSIRVWSVRRRATRRRLPAFATRETVASEGEPEVILEAGASFYQPPGEWHAVGTSAEGARTVGFRVLEKGQPMVVAVE